MSGNISLSSGVGTSRLSGDNEPAHYMLKIESFSLLSETGIEKFESDTFEAGGKKWKLILYPNGNKMDDGENHISLYLGIVDAESLPRGWEVNVYFRFFVYDHVRENYLIIQDADVKKRRFHSRKLEWGFAKLLPLKIFKDTSNGYLVQDTCVFGAEVFVTQKFVVKENCLSMIKPSTTNNTYTLTIENFPTIVEANICSEDFKVGKIKWRLSLYLKGTGKGYGTHLSVFLVVADNASLLRPWRIYAKFKIRVCDQAGTDHVELTENGHWFCTASPDWGFPDLILLKDLNDKAKNYIVKEKLVVEVEIAAMGVFRSCT